MRPATVGIVGFVFLILIFVGIWHIRLALLCISLLLCLFIAVGLRWEGHKSRTFAISLPRLQHDVASKDSASIVRIEGRQFKTDELPSRLNFTVTCRNLPILVAISMIGMVACAVCLLTPGSVLSGPIPDSDRFYLVYALCYLLVALCLPASTWLSECALLRQPGIALASVRGTSSGGLGIKWVRYEFRDPSGGYYGGSVVDFGGPKDDQFKVVFCNAVSPNSSKLSCGLLFHQVSTKVDLAKDLV